jgi:hypothetical protein
LARAGIEMETVFADWASQRTTFPATRLEFPTTRLDGDEDELPESEGIPARSLEILRVLNDVFNTLPGEMGADRD